MCVLALRTVSSPDVFLLLEGSTDEAVPSLTRVGAAGRLSRCVPRTSVFARVIASDSCGSPQPCSFYICLRLVRANLNERYVF